jgi:hypothetical protein
MQPTQPPEEDLPLTSGNGGIAIMGVGIRGGREGLVCALMEDLNANFGLKLDPCPSLESGAVMLETSGDKKIIFVISGSHMSRTVGFLPKDTISLAEPGFVAFTAASAYISGRLQGYGPGPGNVMVMGPLSNSAFCGNDSSGVPLPPLPWGRWYLPCAGVAHSRSSVNDKKRPNRQ